MIKLVFTAATIEQLHHERFHHPHPRVQRKMEALYLKSQGYPHWEIAQLLRVTEPTLLRYFRDYQSGGLDQLKALTFNRPQSALKQHQESLEAYCRLTRSLSSLTHSLLQHRHGCKGLLKEAPGILSPASTGKAGLTQSMSPLSEPELTHSLSLLEPLGCLNKAYALGIALVSLSATW